MAKDKVCIIGAGASGIAAAKVFHQHGIDFDCFEKGSQVGGLWRYNNDNGLSPAYASLHVNTSKRITAYSDFPMPDDYPDYPSHEQMARYFDAVVDHFGLREKITFRTTVTEVQPADRHQWQVTLHSGETRSYRAVVVANGHHWKPRMASFPGTFSGRQLHSHQYRTPEPFAGLRVLVIGIGNSAVDIAVDVCRVAKRTVLSTRRGAHVIPKFVLGRPVDEFITPLMSYFPLGLQRLGFNLLLWMARGRQEHYGIPKPKHKLLQEHPTISSDLLVRVRHGDIQIKPNVRRLDGNQVEFADGSREPFDAIIHCTGYEIAFPFFKNGFFEVRDNDLRLYCRVVPPEHPGLYFIGFVQPLGPIPPLAELQAEWVARLLTGECTLPDRAAMQREIEQYKRKLRRRYVDSPRHTLEVDYYPYIRQLRREMKAGRRRARSRHA